MNYRNFRNCITSLLLIWLRTTSKIFWTQHGHSQRDVEILRGSRKRSYAPVHEAAEELMPGEKERSVLYPWTGYEFWCQGKSLTRPKKNLESCIQLIAEGGGRRHETPVLVSGCLSEPSTEICHAPRKNISLEVNKNQTRELQMNIVRCVNNFLFDFSYHCIWYNLVFRRKNDINGHKSLCALLSASFPNILNIFYAHNLASDPQDHPIRMKTPEALKLLWSTFDIVLSLSI